MGMKFELFNDDCLRALPDIPTETVDAVITDPPYGIAYQSAWRTDKAKRHAPIANDGQPFIWWLADAFRVTRDGGALLCFCRWDVQEAFRQAIQWAGYSVQSQVIWDRESHGMGDLNASFAPRHDVIWFATKGRFVFPGLRPQSVINQMRLDGNSLVHPNEKPVGLMRKLIRSVTPEGGTVLDPFMGSGATGVAAIEEGYRFIGMELDPGHFRTAQSRIQSARHLFVEPQPKVEQAALALEVA